MTPEQQNLIKNLAHQFLNAAIYRTVWSIPLPYVIGSGVVLASVLYVMAG